jgi:hypothetical protein
VGGVVGGWLGWGWCLTWVLLGWLAWRRWAALGWAGARPAQGSDVSAAVSLYGMPQHWRQLYEKRLC